MDYRIGIGYDIHRLVKGRKLFLGGVEIPHKQGLLGHSDGDVLLHAICDSLLGAMSCDDIGRHFPNTDMRYKDIRSSELLKRVYTMMRKKGYSINNLDAVVIAQEPHIGQFKDKMRDVICKILLVKRNAISIKATTAEGVGDIGRNKAIAAYAAVTLWRRKK